MKPSYQPATIVSTEQAEIIQDLVNCALACEACSSLCLKEPDVEHMVRCSELARDCADICFQSARLIMRQSDMGEQSLTLCEEVCRLCAEECRKHQHDHCEVCAAACEKCADTCNSFFRRDK